MDTVEMTAMRLLPELPAKLSIRFRCTNRMDKYAVRRVVSVVKRRLGHKFAIIETPDALLVERLS